MVDDARISIKEKDYQELMDDSIFLQALMQAGVCYWSEYSRAEKINNELREFCLKNKEVSNG